MPNPVSTPVMTPVNTPEALGHAVRAARKQLGLTQPQLALAAGVGVRFIVELEAGKPTVRLENILRVLNALGGSLAVEGLPTATSPAGAA
ncbi:MAG: helix-turn-helix transcriptional regulator [Burkholderiaceae bacterium]|nr:helix-turn-helix transcriptional regulator [Burkholderiaceae bacterium]